MKASLWMLWICILVRRWGGGGVCKLSGARGRPCPAAAGYFLAQVGRNNLILETGPTPGTFFRSLGTDHRCAEAA
jgi:hypothetical protein